MKALHEQAAAGGFAALARRSSFVGIAMAGYDALVMVNLTNTTLWAPKLIARTGGAGQQMEPLLAGGWATTEEFGGYGASALAGLESNGIYLTFVPTGSSVSSFGFAAGGVSLSAINTLTLDGAAAYLIGTPVPEPATWALLLGGVALLLARRQRGRTA